MKSTNHIENLILNYSKGFDKKLINLIPKRKLVQQFYTKQ